MAFTWKSVEREKTPARFDQFNEIVQNSETLMTNLGISAYQWEVMPVSAGEHITYNQLQELRDALDYVDNWNTCYAQNAADNVSDDTGDYPADNATLNTTADDPHYNGDDVGLNSGHLNNDHITDYGLPHYVGRDNSPQDSSVNGTWHGTDYSTPRNTSVSSDVRLKKEIVYI
jgi:hypothetical protein